MKNRNTRNLSTLIILFTFCAQAVSQCNVKKWQKDGLVMTTHVEESIFKFVDHNGGAEILFQFSGMEQSSTSEKIYSISIEVILVGSYKMIAPREIQITFTDNSSLTIFADKLYSPEWKGERQSQFAYFIVEATDLSKVKYRHTEQVLINDTRKGEGIPCKPYSALIKEQVNCVLDEM